MKVEPPECSQIAGFQNEKAVQIDAESLPDGFRTLLYQFQYVLAISYKGLVEQFRSSLIFYYCFPTSSLRDIEKSRFQQSPLDKLVCSSTYK